MKDISSQSQPRQRSKSWKSWKSNIWISTSVSEMSSFPVKNLTFQRILRYEWWGNKMNRLLDIIPTTYHETFIKFFKFLFIYGVIDARKLKNISPSSLDLLNFPDLGQKKVSFLDKGVKRINVKGNNYWSEFKRNTLCKSFTRFWISCWYYWSSNF